MQVIGVDVGGTKTALALVSFPEARVIRRREIGTPAGPASGASFLAAVIDAIEALLAGERCDAVGVGVCELVDRDGNVESAHRVHWGGLPVRDRLQAIAPAVVEADVRAAALAECRWGAGRDYRDLLYLNIGTGISTCFVKDGVPHAGAHGHALAIASAPVLNTCPSCGAESAYVLEDVAGGAAMVSRYEKVCGKAVTSAAEVIDAARSGDPCAVALIAEAGRALGVTLGIALNMLDPEALIVGGGLGGREGAYFDAMEAAIRRQIWSDRARRLPILRAALGADAGTIGAATAAWRADESKRPGA